MTAATTALTACGGSQTGDRPRGAPEEEYELAPLPTRSPALAPFPAGREFNLRLAQHRDLTWAGLARELKLPPPADAPLSFDPTSVRHFDQIAEQLQLTDAELALYQAGGVVGVDHGQRYSMGSAYYAIYTRDLPVLITSDSILHALHRSYDQLLKQLELFVFAPMLADVLDAAHAELARQAKTFDRPALTRSAQDLDLYLTVASKLLRGKRGDRIRSRLGQDATVKRLLADVASLRLMFPGATPPLALYGGERYVDFSQFKPRGHYTQSEELQDYFRALMWLGRADTGFTLVAPPPAAGLKVNVERERRNAGLLALVLRASGGVERLQAMSEVLDLLVGRSDSLTVAEMLKALDGAELDAPTALEDRGAGERLQQQLAAARPGGLQIRSQVLMADKSTSTPVATPMVFQMFGQRFVLDSFLLSQLVFDSIEFKREKIKRMMPSGLDVMAALGNDEAATLLRPEIERLPYAANLLAARKVVEAHAPEHWSDNAYMIWLDSLRTLDDEPARGAHFPEVMRRLPWRRKQLQAQLASWAELRHDTILYAAQSYTGGEDCEYPEGYVEPYPELYRRLRLLASEAARLLSRMKIVLSTTVAEQQAGHLRDYQVKFFTRFAGIMQRLEALAGKELAAQPFSDDERRFIKQAIDQRGGGSGAPRYDGWYTHLIYGEPASWEPTVADVHTDPNDGGRALEVAVGDVNFVVVAIDNDGDRAAYVGPIYSYYEFTQPAEQRLTDEEWQERIRSGKTPARPAWAAAFQAPARTRELPGKTAR